MTHYLVQPTDRIFLKDCGFCLLLNMSKNIAKNISKNLSSKYSRKLLNHAKQYGTDAPKPTSKKAIQKTAKTTDDFTGNKIVDKITKVSKRSPQNSLEAVENETENIGFYRIMSKERHISPEKDRNLLMV